MFDRGLRGKIAVVTGAAHGIGKACALALAEEGANMALLDLDDPASDAVADVEQAARSAGVESAYWQADITSPEQVRNAMAGIQSRFGAVDILVNNAGKGRAPAPLEEITDDVWNEVVALNLTGAMLCARAVVGGMKRKGWGRIVNMSSIAARGRGESPNISYASAKAGLLGFTQQLALEVGRYGVTVNAVAPGGILSGRVVARWAAKSEAEKARTTDAIPLRRIGQPQEVARAVVFLASNDASYITGITLDVNGGRAF